MAYFDPLIAKWATLTPGTTAAKLLQINALTVTGSVPANFLVAGADIFNCLDWTEFAALTAAQQTTMLQICAIPGLLRGGTGSFFAGLIPLFYAGKLGGPTVTAMTALAKATVQPWWQASVANGGGGYSQPIGTADLALAGGLV